MTLPALYRQPDRARLIALVADSHERVVGTPLVAASDDPIAALWAVPRVVVAHGTEGDPLFFFGNAVALEAFEYPPETFVGLPSRLSAEAPERAARAAFLEQVARQGYIADYGGIRISAEGRRFAISGATVWNLVAADGTCHGQAASFVP